MLSKKLVLRFCVSAALGALASPAMSACVTDFCTTIPVGTSTPTYDFLATLNADGSISANLGHSGIGDGTFTDTYTFTILGDGLGSGSLSTGTSFPLGVTDLDFTSVLVNGKAATLTTAGNSEFASIDNVPVVSLVLNTIVVTGVSRGNGSYGGQATFVPAVSSVPEPASWAMMIGGFGLVGSTLRREKKTLAVKFNA